MSSAALMPTAMLVYIFIIGSVDEANADSCLKVPVLR